VTPSCSTRIKDIYKYLCDLDKQHVGELAQSISSMPDQHLYDSIQAIEKLYMELMIEYNAEMQRARSLGIFKKAKK